MVEICPSLERSKGGRAVGTTLIHYRGKRQGKREEGRGMKEEGRGKRDEGRGKREEGRG